MPSDRDHQSLLDILDNIDRIARYTAGMNEAGLAADTRTADALERCIARISEAAVRLGDAAPALSPGLPWRDIRGIGNRLRHAYERIEARTMWNIVTNDLPALRQGCADALKRLPPAR